MDIGKKEILKIFKKNFNSKIVNTPLGDGFLMNSYDAFIFCAITGSGYLDNPIMPFTPKGLLKLFYNALNFNFVTGLFDNSNLKNTPYQLAKLYPFIFEDEYKIIVPIEFKTDIELQDLLFDNIKDLNNSTELIILRVEISKTGNGLEPLMEYIANKFFTNIGFICENQIPLSHTLGSPDFGGYGIPDFYKSLDKYGIFKKGFNVIELAMLRFKNLNCSINNNGIGKELIVGEAKTSTKIMHNQLQKYLSSGFFDFGIEIHPSKTKATYPSSGMLYFDSNYLIKYIEPEIISTIVNIKSQNEYKCWLINYFKFYLIANMTNTEFQNFYYSKKGNYPSNSLEISDFVQMINSEDILEELRKLKII